MLNQFYLERELLVKIERIQKLCRVCRVDISMKVREKGKNLGIKIPVELQTKMCQNVLEEEEKIFDCKFCGKEFNDGRKLGGHISRAHPYHKSGNEGGKGHRGGAKEASMSEESQSEEGFGSKQRRSTKDQKRFKKINNRYHFSMIKKQHNRGDGDEQMSEVKGDGTQNQIFREE